VFYRYDDLQPDALQSDRYDRAVAIATGLPDAEIRSVERHMVALYLPNLGEAIEGDVSRTGLTVYLGGFDWVTFAAPPHVLARFPEYQPLPQQSSTVDEEMPGEEEIPPPDDRSPEE